MPERPLPVSGTRLAATTQQLTSLSDGDYSLMFIESGTRVTLNGKGWTITDAPVSSAIVKDGVLTVTFEAYLPDEGAQP